jgi:hypothetical protein
MELSGRYAAAFRQHPPDTETEARFVELAANSHAEQARLEAADDMPLGDYIARYIAS